MSNDLNNKEKQFKHLAENLDFDLNTEALWSDISEQLPEQKKKRRGWLPFVFFFSAVLLAGFFLGSFMSKKSLNTAIIPSAATVDQEVINENDETKNIFSNANSNHTAAINESDIKSAQSVRKPETSLNNSFNPNNYTSALTQAAAMNLTNENSIPKAFHRAITQTGKEKNETKELKENTQNLKTNNEKNGEGTHQQLSLKKLSMLPTLLGSLSIIKNDKPTPTTILPTKPKNWVSFIQISSGINHNLSSNTLNNGTEILDDAVLNSEKDKIGFNTAFELGFLHRTGWSISTGLNYSSYYSSLSSNSVEITETEIPGTESIIINPDGSQTLVPGSLTKTNTSSTNFLWHRRHKQVDLSLHIGKRLYQLDRFSIGSTMGLMYNIWASHSGYYFDENLSFTKFEKEDTHPYVNRHGLGIQGGLSLGYQIKHIQFSIYPYLRYNTNSITQTTHIYSSRNHQIGLNASFRYLFGN